MITSIETVKDLEFMVDAQALKNHAVSKSLVETSLFTFHSLNREFGMKIVRVSGAPYIMLSIIDRKQYRTIRETVGTTDPVGAVRIEGR
jgi:hypothetical protein